MKLPWRLLIVAALIQLVPFGHLLSPKNRLGTRLRPPAFFAARALTATATRQNGWYSNIAPVSCLVQRDVNEGRSHVNFSQRASPDFELAETLFGVPEPLIRLVKYPRR